MDPADRKRIRSLREEEEGKKRGATGKKRRTRKKRAIGKRSPWAIVRDVVASARGPGQRPLWQVARHCTDVDDLKAYSRALHRIAKLAGTWQDTHERLLEAVANVRFPANDKLIRAALAEADRLTFPELPGRYTTRMRRLAGWGYVLARDEAPDPFWLGGRSVDALFEISYRSAYRLLGLLIADGLFVVVEKGCQGRASRYRYHGPDPGGSA